jgi:hypothetical protein
MVRSLASSLSPRVNFLRGSLAQANFREAEPCLFALLGRSKISALESRSCELTGGVFGTEENFPILNSTNVYPIYRKPFDLIFQAAQTERWWAWGESNSRPSG